MRQHPLRNFHALLLLVLVGLVAGCSTHKNTANSRWWHSFNARYNTYYNGTLAYIDGSLEKENGNKDNFTEVIPLYTVGNKRSKEIGKGNFDKAIEKCQKAIKLHSIKQRPEWNKRRRKTERDLEWLSRKEYNPFLWKAWMLMGRSQFHKGAFDEAASTFAYMSNLYQTQPAIYGRARAWLAKCYIEQDWLYDAEDVIRNMARDSIHWRAQKEWDYTYADYYIHTGEYDKAIPYLRNVIKHEMRKKQKAREYYLLGQLEAHQGNKAAAYKAFQRVIRQNPPYEIEFNARIAMTEVMAAGQWKKMISRLKRMAASDNNKEYLDQVYYAIGNIYMAQRDTANAIANYEKGNEKATRNGIEKGVLLLRLGDIYWTQEKFNDAGRCYGEAIGLLDKEREDYKQLSQRSKVLDELVPYTDAVHLQDSLQALAKMSEKDRNAAIDRVIEALKKKEKEEKRKQDEARAQQTIQRNGAVGNRNNNTPQRPTTNTQDKGKWYFYNPLAVQQGKQAFEKQWGKRENVDNWQRVNKTVVAGMSDDMGMGELTEEMRDSIARAEALADSLEQVNDSAQNDPHKREYYLAQIPFTEDQVAASNLILQDGLFNSGVIFKDKLDNLPLSEKALRRLTDTFPEFEQMPDVYYHLFLLYSRKGQPDVAESYVNRLKNDYPDNQWTTILTDPYFTENAQFGKQVEDSLYGATYNAFKADRFGEVKGNAHISETRFPLGANRDKFIFINGLSKLNNGDGDGCLADMKLLVEKFPQSKLAEMAGMIVNGVKEGRRLHGGKFDLGDVWSRRSVVLSDSDSIAARKLSPDPNANFVFMIAYQPDSVDENKLLFELARYNFTSYMVRNFDITIDDVDGLSRMQVSGFRNFDEALQYARQFYQQQNIVERLGKSRTIIVSEQNLPLLGQQFSYDDYDEFYAEHFAPLKISTAPLLSEPAEIGYEKEPDFASPADEEGQEGTNGGQGAGQNAEDELFPTDDNQQPTPANQQQTADDGGIVVDDQQPTPANQQPESDDGGIVIDDQLPTPANQQPASDDGGIVIDDQLPTPANQQSTSDDDGIIIDDQLPTPANQQSASDDDGIILDDQLPTTNAQEPADDDDEIIIDDQQTTTEDDDEIILDDDTPTDTPQQQQKEDASDLEDEYFDLDGF